MKKANAKFFHLCKKSWIKFKDDLNIHVYKTWLQNTNLYQNELFDHLAKYIPKMDELINIIIIKAKSRI